MASFLKLERIFGFLVLPGYDPMPCCLYDGTTLPVLEGIVGRHAEVRALRIPEVLDVNAPDCSSELYPVQLFHDCLTVKGFLFGETEEAVFREYDVVQEPDLHEVAGLLQPGSEMDVLNAR